MKLSVNTLVLIALTLSATSSLFALQDENEKTPQADKQVIETLLDATSSKSELVQSRAFSLLSQQKEVSKFVESDVLASKIKTALRHPESKIRNYGFKLLDNSKLDTETQQKILFNAIGADAGATSTALKRLTEQQTELLPKIIRRIEKDLTASHVSRIRLLEHWGPKAKTAVPVLIAHYEALKKSDLDEAIEREAKRKARRKQTNELKPNRRKIVESKFDVSKLLLDFDFLHIVYAISSIGTDAIDAMPIAIAATNKQRDSRDGRMSKEKYHLAGIMCMERLLGTEQSNSTQGGIGGLLGSSGGGAMMGNMIGGSVTSKASRSKSTAIRSSVEQHMARLKKTNAVRYNTVKIDEQVELTFQNYDVELPEGVLTLAEFRKLTPPILFSKVDSDSDKKVTKEELKQHFIKKSKSQSRTSRSRTVRSR